MVRNARSRWSETGVHARPKHATNATEGIDQAFLRRFIFAIEVGGLTERQRQRVWCRHLGDEAPLPTGDVADLAGRFTISPAQVANAIAAARLATGDGTVDRDGLVRMAAPIERIVSGRVVGHHRSGAADVYLPEAVCSSIDAAALVDRLAGWDPQGGEGVTLCLYGRPGTGKSELVRQLARRMGRPLLVRRGSDLLSKYVGETEQRIADAFREAAEDGAILLFDEADTFLLDRRSARARWEVSQVNEFLQQLEVAPGVVACTTNLFHELDQAALRRFSIKVAFDYLRPEQSSLLFRTVFANVLAGEVTEEAVALLAQIPALTPGDFAVVARRLRVLGRTLDARALIDELRAEVRAKQMPSRVAGFTVSPTPARRPR